jgi:hypothetical protein
MHQLKRPREVVIASAKLAAKDLRDGWFDLFLVGLQGTQWEKC